MLQLQSCPHHHRPPQQPVEQPLIMMPELGCRPGDNSHMVRLQPLHKVEPGHSGQCAEQLGHRPPEVGKAVPAAQHEVPSLIITGVLL